MFDLHSHTICSDGALTPLALKARAAERGVHTLAITDHDTVNAFTDAELMAEDAGPRIIPGIEFSTRWGALGIHVLGLNINPDCAALHEGVAQQSGARRFRAEQIGEAMARKGMPDAFDRASALAGDAALGRVHFARALVELGHVPSLGEAFKRHLGDGKAGDIRQHWAELPAVIEWIRGSGGIAVLAHPLKYKLTRTRLRRLLGDFAAAGGQGMEVISGRQLKHYTQSMGELCIEFELLASCGSDFHQPGPGWAELGAFGELPRGVIPVWERF